MPRGVHIHHRHRVRRRGAPYGRGVSKASTKCYFIVGVIVLVMAAIFIVIGALCLSGVIRGRVQLMGTPLVCLGGGAVMTGLILLMMSCQAAMQQSKASPAQTNGQYAGQSRVNPAVYPVNPAVYPVAPVRPQPYPSASPLPVQPPPYSWGSPAPYGQAPASSVQGPYSGHRSTATPDPKMGYSNPSFAPQVAKDQSSGSTASSVSP